ncbi:MAG: PAS domain-containing protein [Hyphomicrobiaceae bacterium]
MSAAKDREQRAQRMLKRVVGASPDAIYVYHVPWRRIAFLGHGARDVFGFAAARSHRLRLAELEQLVHPADLAHFRRHLAAIERARDGEILSHELRIKGTDGCWRWLRLRATVLARAKAGAVAKVVGVVTDIGTCRGANADLQAGDRLVDILASIDDCYIAIDRDYRIVDANAKAEAWLRASRADIVGQSYLELIAPTADHAEALRQAVELGAPRSIELPSTRRPGTWVDLRIHPSRDGVSVFFRDITQRKRAEREVERSRGLLQSSLDALAAEIAILDETGTVVAANKAWQGPAVPNALSGAAVGSDYLAYCERALRNDEGEGLRRALRSVLNGERRAARFAYSVEMDGERRWLQVSAARFEWDGDTCLIVANEDLTDVKQAREALSEMSGRISSLREEERQRIAQELHDSTAQHLVAATLNLMTLKARAVVYPGVLQLLENVESSLEEATRELRVFTYLLHPLALENDGLERTLRTYLDGFARRTGLKAEMYAAGEVEGLPFALQCSLLRIIQEALANVHRHAGASHVSIGLKATSSALRLAVNDDGRGMPGPEGQAEPVQKGVGIAGMRSRLRDFGGTLEIHSSGRGTTLVATVPLPAPKRWPRTPERTLSVVGALDGGSHRS